MRVQKSKMAATKIAGSLSDIIAGCHGNQFKSYDESRQEQALWKVWFVYLESEKRYSQSTLVELKASAPVQEKLTPTDFLESSQVSFKFRFKIQLK